MTKNPNNNKNMIDKVCFLRYLFALAPIQKCTAAFPPHFFFLMLNIQKNIKSPGGNTMNYTGEKRRAFVMYTMLHNVCK